MMAPRKTTTRAPAIVCDPQGLTIYDDRRIRFQWRWRELDSVLYDAATAPSIPP